MKPDPSDANAELRRRAAIHAAVTGASMEQALLLMVRAFPDLVDGSPPAPDGSRPRLGLVEGAAQDISNGGTEMTAIERLDAAAAAAMQADPKLTLTEATRLVLNENPQLYEAYRAQASDASAEGRRTFAEAQGRCRVLGGGSTALAAAQASLHLTGGKGAPKA